MCLSFRRVTRRSISEISELESERTRVTSLEDEAFSPDCEVKTEIADDDDDTVEVSFV